MYNNIRKHTIITRDKYILLLEHCPKGLLFVKIGITAKLPSKRKALHADCPNSCYAKMVRYGVDCDRDECSETTPQYHPLSEGLAPEHGHDEVDNIQSKLLHRSLPSRKSSPLLKTDTNPLSARSLNNTRSDRNILSTSLPTTLPSHSNFSFNSSDEDYLFRRTDRSVITSDEGCSDSELNRCNNSPRQQRSSSRRPTQTKKSAVNDSRQEHPYNKLLPILVIVIGYFVAYFIPYFWIPVKKNLYSEVNFASDLNKLGQLFLDQDDPILKIQTGILTIGQKEDAGSFIFVYNSDNPSHDGQKFNDFVDGVGALAAKYLRNETAEVCVINKIDPVLLNHGEFIGRYRDALENQGVLLVRRLQEVPSHLAMAFHYYCDEHSPLVKKSAIFFTLDLKDCQSDNRETTHSVIEKCLSNVWKTLPQYNLAPLLTRVVNVIVKVDL